MSQPQRKPVLRLGPANEANEKPSLQNESPQPDARRITSPARLRIKPGTETTREAVSRTYEGTRQNAPPIVEAVSAKLDAELLQIATAQLNDNEWRASIRDIAMRHAGAVGVCHITRTFDGEWVVRPLHVSGRMPRPTQVKTFLSERSEQITQQASAQIEPLADADGHYGVAIPLQGSETTEILFLFLNDKTDAKTPALVAEKVVRVMQVAMQLNAAKKEGWKINSLSAVMELVSQIESSATLDSALHLVANEFARFLGCSSVAIQFDGDRQRRRVVVSGTSKIDRSSDSYHAYQQCLAESRLRNEFAAFPAGNTVNDHLLLAHRQLASALHGESVASQPLTVGEKVSGAWLATYSPQRSDSETLKRTMQVATPSIGCALAIVRRAQKSRLQRGCRGLMRWLFKLSSLFKVVAVIALLSSLAISVPYQVRGGCVVEPATRRFAVAPYDGILLQGFVRPGDHVTEGQLLAELDGRSLSFELAGVAAEREKYKREREINLAEGAISEMLIAELNEERLAAQHDLLRYRQEHLQLRSPIDGVVLSGSLDRAQAASVTTGQVLFEIGSTDSYHIQVEIPADDIPHIHPGNAATVWVEGRESEPIEGEISRIFPRSEIRNARNVFVAEIELDPEQVDLRPGNRGSVRITGDMHSIAWNLFHKPLEYVRARWIW